VAVLFSRLVEKKKKKNGYNWKEVRKKKAGHRVCGKEEHCHDPGEKTEKGELVPYAVLREGKKRKIRKTGEAEREGGTLGGKERGKGTTPLFIPH